MRRATLIHNVTAGDGHPSGGELRELVGQLGHTTSYATTDDDLDTVLQDPGDLVVVAGGDGTVGHVAARLVGREIPLAILPVGTANNLAVSLGIQGPLDRLAEGWSSARRRPLNVAVARGPWGERPLVESFGLGLFPHVIPVLSALKKGPIEPMIREAQIRQDRLALRQLVEQFVPRCLEFRLDGQDASGEYLMVEVMNAPMLGPQLPMAPAADPGDGRLEVVLVREQDRRRLERWLDDPRSAHDLEVRTTRTVDLDWYGEPLHIDGETWAFDDAPFRSVHTVPGDAPAPVQVRLAPGTVPILVPSR